MQELYCNSLTSYSRLVTREVKIGDLPLGANNPIRIQSMTTTDTMDTAATVEQSIRMINAGSDYVRITAPSINEAKNLENIKKELRNRGYSTPLIADIHFTPNAAEMAARIVEKVRVNPGNFADKKKFDVIEYSDSDYSAELDRIRSRFIPLVKICKEYGTAMRIGTNHGSLSDRIMSRYGDTALGMVESALEFLRICEGENYYNIVLSMKSSNPLVMVEAYRLLIKQMHAEGMNYPLHLGVTEAGEGEDGRIKSAAGIGTLLEDGIGDTIRVSLTEDPEFELPVARMLVEKVKRLQQSSSVPTVNFPLPFSPYEFKRREINAVKNIGNIPVVIADLSASDNITPAVLFGAGYRYSRTLDKWNIGDQACDYIYAGNNVAGFEIPGTLGIIYNAELWSKAGRERCYPLFYLNDFINSEKISDELNFVIVSDKEIYSNNFIALKDRLLQQKAVLVLETAEPNAMQSLRRMFMELQKSGFDIPVIIKRKYDSISADQIQLYASSDFGGLFLDGFGDGIWIDAGNIARLNAINSLSFGILQACRMRTSKAEYISCPSCGRTLFDLQETTAKIRNRTSHLKGIKIGIMGCIVNGPGEMADADYGYVGSGPGKITLYKGKEVVQRNVDTAKAVDALIDLIKQHGDWTEAPEESVEINIE